MLFSSQAIHQYNFMISVPHTCIYNTLIPDINQLGPVAPKHGNLDYLCAVHYVCSHVGGSGGMLPQNSFFNMAFWVCLSFSGILGGKIHCFHSDSAETKQLRQIPPQLNYTQHTRVFYLSETLLIRIYTSWKHRKKLSNYHCRNWYKSVVKWKFMT